MGHEDSNRALSIGFEAKRAFHNFTGLGNYSRTLLRQLRQYHPEFNLSLFTPRARAHPRTEDFLAEPGYNIVEARGLFASYWRSFGQARDVKARGIDIYHGLAQELPTGLRKGGIKQLLTVHDIIFRTYPKHYSLIDRNIYHRKLAFACREADQIVAISQATQQDLIQVYQVPASKVKVIYQNCEAQFRRPHTPEANRATLTKYGLTFPYIVYVGSVIKRKNLLLVIEGMGLLPNDLRPMLVVVGKGGSYLRTVKEKISELGLEKRVMFLPDLPFSAFSALYQEAMFSVYPSEYEGFGIPALESIASGTAVITSKESSLPEAAGNGGHYLEDIHPVPMAEAIEKLLSDTAYREELEKQGKLYSQRFNDQAIADQWADTYRALS